MSDRWTERLSEYVDGDLSERDRGALEAHLPGCASCRATIEELQALLSRARTLEPSEPVVDLWPAIAARIETAPRRAPARRPLGSRRLSLSLPQAALASLALVAITAVTMWWTVGRAPRLVTRGPSDAGVRSVAVGTGPAAPSPATTSMARRGFGSGVSVPRGPSTDDALDAAFSDPRYDATIAELQNILQTERSRLDPSTVKVVEKNLKIIDRAVDEARRAVAADPSSLYLREHLAQVMMQKVSLLRQATRYAFAQG